MSLQKFYACPKTRRTEKNGAVVYGSGYPFQVIPYSKVANCPIAGTDKRVTAYQTSAHPDSFFSVSACCKLYGRYIGGYFTGTDEGVEFRPYDRYKARLVKGGAI